MSENGKLQQKGLFEQSEVWVKTGILRSSYGNGVFIYMIAACSTVGISESPLLLMFSCMLVIISYADLLRQVTNQISFLSLTFEEIIFLFPMCYS